MIKNAGISELVLAVGKTLNGVNGLTDITMGNLLESKEKIENIPVVNNQPCVCGACVMCTGAKQGAKAVHIIKKGKSVEIGGLSELTKQDITLEKRFEGCKVLDDGKCCVAKNVIEGEKWQAVDETQSNGIDKETLNYKTSYMTCTKGYGIIYFISAGQILKDYVKEMSSMISIFQEQFGFDFKAASILYQIYSNIQNKYKDLSIIEQDWYFTRALSQLGGYNNKSVKLFFIIYETDAWKKGAGIVYKYDNEKNFFCEELKITEEDYNYIRFMIRLQHFITSDSEQYSYDAVLELKNKDKDQFKEWKENMEKAFGKKLSDDEYIDQYKEIYYRVKDTGDCSHMLYTIASNLIDKGKGVDNSWNNPGASELSWSSKEERKDITGWLGDAVYTGDNNKVSFGNDDFIADLDADNISHRILNGLDLSTAMEKYYQSLSLGNEDVLRTKEFLTNNSYEDVEETIFKRIKVKDINDDRKKTMEDLKDNIIYEDTYTFLEKLKQIEG